MVNQSFVSVPPNLDDPTVLRRFLSRLIEELDVVFGNRAGTDTSYISEQTVQELLDSVDAALTELNTALQAVSEATSDSLLQAVEDLETQINNLNAELNSKPSTGVISSFTVDSGTGDPIIELSSNVSSMSHVSTGVYSISLSATSIEGNDIIDYSTFSVSYTANTALIISVERTSVSEIRLYVRDLTDTLVDINSTQRIDFTALYIPGAVI